MAIVTFKGDRPSIMEPIPGIVPAQGEADMQVIKVSAESNPAKVAGAIANTVRSLNYEPNGEVEVHVVGERSNYLAAKAIKMAKEYLSSEQPHRELSAAISTEDVELSGKGHVLIIYRIGWQAKIIKEAA